MFEMAASAVASFVARSLVAIVSCAGSWRKIAFCVPPSSVNSADIRQNLMARHMVDLPVPVSSAASRNLKTTIVTRPMRHCWDDSGATWLTKGLSPLRLLVDEPQDHVAVALAGPRITVRRVHHGRLDSDQALALGVELELVAEVAERQVETIAANRDPDGVDRDKRTNRSWRQSPGIESG